MPGDSSSNLELRLSLVEKEMVFYSKIYDKIDVAIEKLTQISGDIKEMVTIHEQKLKTQDDVNTFIEKSLDSHKKDDEEVHDKFETVLKEELGKLQNEVDKKFEKLNKKLTTYDYIKYIAIGLIIAAAIVLKFNIPFLTL